MKNYKDLEKIKSPLEYPCVETLKEFTKIHKRILEILKKVGNTPLKEVLRSIESKDMKPVELLEELLLLHHNLLPLMDLCNQVMPVLKQAEMCMKAYANETIEIKKGK